MIKLYQREDCRYCARVRRFLEEQGISYEAVPVVKLGSDRADVLALAGISDPEVPVLVDGDRAIQGSGEILAYLAERYTKRFFGDPSYALTRRVKGMTYGDTVEATKDALAKEGFGVLTEIDVKATLKKKLDVDFRNFIILGACNPPLAHRALSAEPGIGVLLPCNVVVSEEDDGTAVISAIDPIKMFSVVGRADVEPIAQDVGARLRRVLAAIG